MASRTTNLMETFRQEKLMPDETLEADIKGWLDRKTGQGVIQHNGQFVLTNKRACFYSEAPLGDIRDDPTLENNIGRNVVTDGLPCPPCSHG